MLNIMFYMYYMCIIIQYSIKFVSESVMPYLEDWSYEFTWPTPGSPEVNDEDLVAYLLQETLQLVLKQARI